MIDWISCAWSGADAGRVTDQLINDISHLAQDGGADVEIFRTDVSTRIPALSCIVNHSRVSAWHMLRASGAHAHVVALRAVLPAYVRDYACSWSISRLDLQRTVVVQDADFLIRNAQSSHRYHRLLLDPSPERGVTLYVGSPKSRVRLRVYNKSAQSGEYPESGEYLRVELQSRNENAELIWNSLALDGDKPQQVLNASLYQRTQMMVPSLTHLLELPHVSLDMTVPRPQKKYADWLFYVVLPALRRIEVLDRELFDRFKAAIYNFNAELR